jgi:SAM-dependent methyltransferase
MTGGTGTAWFSAILASRRWAGNPAHHRTTRPDKVEIRRYPSTEGPMTYTDPKRVHIAKDQSKGRTLDIYAHVSEVLFGHSYLHWGYWEDPDNPGDLTFLNLIAAQRAFLEKMVSQIPPDVETILDIGSGTGEFAHYLQAEGYAVTCICPSLEQNKMARRKLAPGTVIHECRFEAFEPSQTYDMAIFCESLQYMTLPEAFEKLARCAKYVLIADYHKISPQSRQGGGFSWPAFDAARADNGYEIVSHVDMTRNVKPNQLFKRRAYLDLYIPVIEIISERIRQRYPVLSKFVPGSLRRRIVDVERLRKKGERADPEKLTEWIEYCLILLQRR